MRSGAVRGGKRVGQPEADHIGRTVADGNRRYTVYLVIVALASYDLTLLVLTVPDVAQELNLSGTLVGSLVFFVSAAQ